MVTEDEVFVPEGSDKTSDVKEFGYLTLAYEANKSYVARRIHVKNIVEMEKMILRYASNIYALAAYALEKDDEQIKKTIAAFDVVEEDTNDFIIYCKGLSQDKEAKKEDLQ
jgi:hypothetical protein